MSDKPKLYTYKTLPGAVTRLRDDLKVNDFILLFAFNRTGKTRLSTAFKDKGKKGGPNKRDTLYFNAFTEDLFTWDNDLEYDTTRVLNLNRKSKFFDGYKELALEEKIFKYLERYAEFDFRFDYEKWYVTFSKRTKNPLFGKKPEAPEYITRDHVKISRGEENIFKWCFFLAICELTMDDKARTGPYRWVEYFYIDDPVSSLDDNHAIAVASDLCKLLRRIEEKDEEVQVRWIKCVISTHHSLFFNVICNELKGQSHTKYFLHKNGQDGHTLQKTTDTPSFHHVALLAELKRADTTGVINTYHFNALRSVLERTATFFGFDEFSKCIHGVDDDLLYERALNLLSHGKYSVYEPAEMSDDNKDLFRKILSAFTTKYEFELPNIFPTPKAPTVQA
jgi:hypothetical protein